MPINSTHSDYANHVIEWARLRAFAAGQDAVRKATTTYLPQPSGMNAADYAGYLSRAAFYNATARTVDLLKGAIFRKPTKVDCSDQLKRHLANIDLAGTPFEIFFKMAVQEVLLMGRYGIFIDFPGQPGEGQPPLPRELQRPNWVGYAAENILSWRTQIVNGAPRVSMVVLREYDSVVDPRDEFASTPVTRYRVLDFDQAGAYRVRIYESGVPDTPDFNLVANFRPNLRNQSLTTIPFYFIGPTSLDAAIDTSPLLDIVNLNWSHYQTSADYHHQIHWTANPVAVFAGNNLPTPDKLLWGPSHAILIPSGDAKWGMLEISGAAIGSAEKALQNDERRMAELGAELLRHEADAAETASAVRIRNAGRNANLVSIADTISEGLTRALRFHAAWADESPEAVAETLVTLNDDFLEARLDPTELTALMQIRQAGEMSGKTLRFNVERGELYPDGWSADDEKKELANEARSVSLDEVPLPVLESMLKTLALAGFEIPQEWLNVVGKRLGLPKIQEMEPLPEIEDEDPIPALPTRNPQEQAA